jgi:hypothetical protein
MKMAKCTNCKKRIRASEEEVKICPHCGFAQGEGLSDLSLIEPLAQEDQYNSQSKVQLLGKLAFGVLLLLLIGVVGYAAMNPVEPPNAEDVSND